MKRIIVILGFAAILAGCNSKQASAGSRPLTTPTLVEAACGRCMFARKEDKKCNLAVRLNGQSYFVDGFNIQQFGNPDLHGGMCKKIHKAHVTGKFVDARFAATTFELLSLASR